jgi:hypothetical protein
MEKSILFCFCCFSEGPTFIDKIFKISKKLDNITRFVVLNKYYYFVQIHSACIAFFCLVVSKLKALSVCVVKLTAVKKSQFRHIQQKLLFLVFGGH